MAGQISEIDKLYPPRMDCRLRIGGCSGRKTRVTVPKSEPPYRKPVNFVPIAAFVTPQQRDGLKALSAKTRIPQQALLREALDDLLAKHSK